MYLNTQKQISPSYSLVMTACINPAARTVKRADINVRLQDYESSLKLWLKLPDSRIKNIIFIDNSGYPLDSLIAISQKDNIWQRKCEFISLNCNEIPPGVHYGYAEFKLLDIGLAQSKLFSDSQYIIKVTGRYQYPSLSRLINRLPQEYKLAADARDVSRFVPYPRKNVTSGLIIFEVDFYQQYIRDIYQRMQAVPRKAFIEDILYDELVLMRNQPGVILRWPCNCEPQGIGGDGDSYTSGKKKILAACRSIGRVILPTYWF